MTWHKKGTRYNPNKLAHPSNAEAWTRFDGIHRDKAGEARNIHVALETNGFHPYGMVAAPYTCWPVFVIPLSPTPHPRCPLSTTEHILIVDNSRTLRE